MQYEFEDLHKFQYQAFFFPLSFSSKFLFGLICLTSKAKAVHDVTSVVDVVTLVMVSPSCEI
jgi:hypothetical protein